MECCGLAKLCLSLSVALVSPVMSKEYPDAA